MTTSMYGDMSSLMDSIMQGRYSDDDGQLARCQALLEIAERENALYCSTFAHVFLGDYYISQSNCIDGGFHLNIALQMSSENGFDDQVPRIYNLLGICYELLGDAQTAVQYYLRSLQQARNVNDGFITSIILNNIAGNFELLRDYNQAKKHYTAACEVLETLPADLESLGYIKLRVWGNCAEIEASLDNADGAKSYLQMCESLQGDLNVTKLHIVNRGWCRYYALTGDAVRAVEHAQSFLTCAQTTPYPDKLLTFEMLISICNTMITLGEQEFAHQMLGYAFELMKDGECDVLRKLNKLRVEYFDAFGSCNERNTAYEEYYRAMEAFELNTFESRSLGLQSIIYLDELKNKLEQEATVLGKEAHLDELTQVFNRRHFNKTVSKAFSDTDLQRIGFIMIDVDYFREYNNSYGHTKGDMALVAVAATLARHATPAIIPCRYGGDEFAVLCLDLDDDDIAAYIEAVRDDLATQHVEHKDSNCADTLTLSIGYSSSATADSPVAELLLDQADQALYLSKSAGRNTFTRWTQ